MVTSPTSNAGATFLARLLREKCGFETANPKVGFFRGVLGKGSNQNPDRSETGFAFLYPFTLILENDNTARLGVGRPIDSAGRNVVKISMRFTCGNTSCETSGSERIR